MTELEIKDLKKLYYPIGEVAKLFNVNPSLIRFWEKEFNFEASKKTQKGNRLYSVKDIQNFNKIYHLVKNEGFTLEGAKKSLKSSKASTSSASINSTGSASENQSKEELISKLEDIKKRLLDLK
ncbi:MAG: MerR family transcriptional regulator [Bacteroidota bacterium]